MFSQSLFAQLMRMTLLLVLSLLLLHDSPRLLNLLAEQVMNSGCHQHNVPNVPNYHHH